MNKFQELGAGLVLLLGGDSPAALRAGDALLAARIDEAIVEGGFDDISYERWGKAEGRNSTLEFDGIRLARGAGDVFVERALLQVFSQSLRFFDGVFAWGDSTSGWDFEQVAVERIGLFGASLRVTAASLSAAHAPSRASCVERRAGDCDLDGLGEGRIDRFAMEFRPRSRRAVVTLAWQRASSCRLAWTADGRGAADLAAWGAAYLDAPASTAFVFADLPCERFRESDLDELRSLGERERPHTGEAVHDAAPVLMQTLFGLVAESYAYLLE